MTDKLVEYGCDPMQRFHCQANAAEMLASELFLFDTPDVLAPALLSAIRSRPAKFNFEYCPTLNLRAIQALLDCGVPISPAVVARAYNQPGGSEFIKKLDLSRYPIRALQPGSLLTYWAEVSSMGAMRCFAELSIFLKIVVESTNGVHHLILPQSYAVQEVMLQLSERECRMFHEALLDVLKCEWDPTMNVIRGCICELLARHETKNTAALMWYFRVNIATHARPTVDFVDAPLIVIQAALDSNEEDVAQVVEKYGASWMVRLCEGSEYTLYEHEYKPSSRVIVKLLELNVDAPPECLLVWF
jgi:hypothetical protein